MTPVDALRQTVREARRFEYRLSDQWGPWKGRAQMERDGHGVCRDFAAWAIERAYDFCPGRYRLVIGDVTVPSFSGDVRVTSRGRHAWCAIVGEDGQDFVWGDATPGWPLEVAPPTEWGQRTALVASDYDGAIFCDEWEYGK